MSLRAFLRTFLQKEQIAKSNAIEEFLTRDPIELNEEEQEDIERRRTMDKKRLEEQTEFYRIARERAAEIDVHMEKFRREVVENSKLMISSPSSIARIKLTLRPKTGLPSYSPRLRPRTQSRN